MTFDSPVPILLKLAAINLESNCNSVSFSLSELRQ